MGTAEPERRRGSTAKRLGSIHLGYAREKVRYSTEARRRSSSARCDVSWAMPPRSGGAGPRIATRTIRHSPFSTAGSPQPHSLQILPFRAVERDRMVGAGARSRHHREWDTRVPARREDDFLEEVSAHEAGAGARQKQAARRDQSHREAVDILISPSGSFDVRSLLREGGGVADHDVPMLLTLDPAPQVLENVRPHEIRVVGRQRIGYPLTPRQRKSRFRGIDVDGARRSSRQRGDREGAGIGEEVQDGSSLRERLQAAPIVSLIEKEASLLAEGDIGDQIEIVL